MPETIRELLTTSAGTEGSLLIEKKIFDTLIESVKKRLIGRQLAAYVIGPDGIPGSSVDVNLVTPDSMRVFAVAEGAAIPLDAPAYTSINLKPLKYAVRIAITKEMMEDGKWNMLENALMYAGREMAENEDNLIIADALDNAASTQSGGATLAISDITTAMLGLENNDYKATDLIMGYECLSDLRNIDTFVEANKLGTREMLETGYLGTLFGMKCWQFSTNVAPSSTYAKYAYIIDKDHAFVIAEKRPVTVENYDDKTFDLSGAVVTQRIKVSYLRTAAIYKITTS
jgi:HK97 family phage major capsid protein